MVCDAAEVISSPVRTATARLCTVKTLVGPTAVALMTAHLDTYFYKMQSQTKYIASKTKISF